MSKPHPHALSLACSSQFLFSVSLDPFAAAAAAATTTTISSCEENL
jgi:hypothetical protein